MDGHTAWFNEYLTRSDDHMFIIESEGTPVGQIGLYHIADDRTDAEFGRLMIGDRFVQPMSELPIWGKHHLELIKTSTFTNVGLS